MVHTSWLLAAFTFLHSPGCGSQASSQGPGWLPQGPHPAREATTQVTCRNRPPSKATTGVLVEPRMFLLQMMPHVGPGLPGQKATLLWSYFMQGNEQSWRAFCSRPWCREADSWKCWILLPFGPLVALTVSGPEDTCPRCMRATGSKALREEAPWGPSSVRAAKHLPVVVLPPQVPLKLESLGAGQDGNFRYAGQEVELLLPRIWFASCATSSASCPDHSS